MATPFKDLIDAQAALRLGQAIAHVQPAFPLDAYAQAAAAGLDQLELKARVKHIAAALRAALPAHWPDALAWVLASLPPALHTEDPLTHGFYLWPLLQLVEQHAADPDHSLPALHALTQRFSAEFAIRPYLEAFPEQAWAEARVWARDPNLHVRRLASEGTRPRLPWGLRLKAGVEDPTQNLALLALLLDDPAPYVRRSVANHLGDIAKDHPELAVAHAARWQAQQPSRQPMLKHALRTLAKAGHPGALALQGVQPATITVHALRLAQPDLNVGQPLQVSATLSADRATTLRVDLVWRWPAKRAGMSERTFVGASRAVQPGEPWQFSSTLATKPVTTRPLRPGPQELWVRIQGELYGPLHWTLSHQN